MSGRTLPAGALEICKKFDKNGDGYISKNELKQAVGGSLTAKEADDLMKNADVNKDGKVNYEGGFLIFASTCTLLKGFSIMFV